MVQSNNATYGGTGQIEQQFAITRARAMEARREIAVATTNSVSGFIDRDGRVVQRTDGVHRRLVGGRRCRCAAALTPAVRGRALAGPRCWPSSALVCWRSLGWSRAAGAVAGPAPDRPTAVGDRRPTTAQPATEQARRPDERRRPPTLGRVLVIIPTYNEVENIDAITAPAAGRGAGRPHVLVADDNSPDGTGKLADELAAADDHIHVLHRLGKEGLGAAYLAGFGWGLERGYDVLVEMDADGSHQPEQLPRLLAALAGRRPGAWARAGCTGGKVVNWPQVARDPVPRRQPVDPDCARASRCGTPPAASTPSGAETLRGIGLDNVASAGYCFQVDLGLAGAQGRLPGGRGADHLRRAGVRRLQDEPADRGRGAAPDHRVGGRAPGRAAAPARRDRAGRRRDE